MSSPFVVLVLTHFFSLQLGDRALPHTLIRHNPHQVLSKSGFELPGTIVGKQLDCGIRIHQFGFFRRNRH